MKNIIEKALSNAVTYETYKTIVAKLMEEGKVTGHTQSEALLHYSQLNETRMKRLDKTIAITDAIQKKIKELPISLTWLVISEGWCGDAAQLLPIMNKMAEFSSKIDLKIVLRDDNEALMNVFLTNGSRSIPKLILWDATTKEVIGDWGPRPLPAKKLIADYKALHGVIDETAKIELQKWYLQDKGITTQEEIYDLIASYLHERKSNSEEILH
ncbi:thioredoxin family protein [Flavobacterium sp. TP390]|uniref:Thioredoxin family protein n=1 Tax=Flavobacterium profundi TaxID=1774945 RepID=A0A6I4ITD1_9FLAO|nr:thioredoxin family protein [Flavobacterium profundi]MVO10105.1 thioredoxin family protein [Flavobacterium profundi]